MFWRCLPRKKDFSDHLRYLLRNINRLLLIIAIAGLKVWRATAASLPAIQWTALARNTNSLGSANSVRAMAVDAAGNTFVAAKAGADGSLQFGTNKVTFVSNNDAIALAKMDAAGNWLWVKSTGAALKGTPYALAVDAMGNCYVAGTIGPGFTGNGTVLFGTNNLELGIYDYVTWLIASDTSAKAFVAKFSAAGLCQWVRGARSGYSEAYAVAVSPNGNVSFGGKFGSKIGLGSAAPVTSQNYQFSATNNYAANLEDCFVATYDSNGVFQWAATVTNSTGSYREGVLSLCTDSDNNVNVAGLFAGTRAFPPIM